MSDSSLFGIIVTVVLCVTLYNINGALEKINDTLERCQSGVCLHE
jgi:hypothetical protein